MSTGDVYIIPARPAKGQPSRFSFAFGSSILQGHDVPALQVAKRHAPVFFAMIGNLGFLDDAVAHPDAQDYRGYSKLFRGMLARRQMSSLLHRTPLFAVQDEHDYGHARCWSGTIKPYAAQAFADIVPGAVWPGKDYRSWSIGEVDFFLTDNRRFKDPPNGPFENGAYMSVLGSAQRGWLLSSLAASHALAKVVFIPMSMTWQWSAGEVAEVRTFIQQHVSGPVIFLSGDKRAGAFVRQGDIWELLAGPLEHPHKQSTPNRPGVVWTENGTGRAKYDVVGVVDVDTTKAAALTLRLMSRDGTELHHEVVPLAAATPNTQRLAQGLADPNNIPNTPLSYGTLTPNPSAQADNQRVPGVSGFAMGGSPLRSLVVPVVVINVGWHQLQDASNTGTTIKSPNIIDRVLDEIRSMNSATPGLDMKAILRVFAGIRVPDGVRNLAPGPLLVKDSYDGKENLMGPFWTPAFAQAYAALQQGLAARYDSEPLITGNVMSQCSLFYPEPYIRDIGTVGNPADQMGDGKTTGQRLLAAGYTDAANDVALQQMFTAHSVWRTTPSICAFNPYPRLNAATGGSAGIDAAKTVAQMDLMRSILDSRAVLANYSVRRNGQAPPNGPVGGPAPYEGYMQMYQHMVDLGQPIMYQTARKPNLCQNPTDGTGACWDDPKGAGGVLDWATSYGPDAATTGNAVCLELIAEWATDYDPATLSAFGDRMKAHSY